MKNVLKIFGMLVLLALFFLFKEHKEVQFNNGVLSYGIFYRPILSISPHISPRPYLFIGGKMYEDVYGLPPYLIKEDQGKYTVVVTKIFKEGREQKRVHIIDSKDDSSVFIDIGWSDFGRAIGTKDDIASVIDSERIRLVSDGLVDRKETLIINLKTKTLESKNTEQKVRRSNWDQDGNEIK